MGNILNFIRNHLSLKILLVLSVSVTMVMGAVIYLNTKHQQRQAKESMKTFGRELKFLAYAGLKHPMSVGDSSSVNEQLLAINEITKDFDIVICDFRQKIVFATHEDEISKDVSHFIRNKEALAHMRDLLRNGTPYYEKLFEEEVDGKKYLITIHRMLNDKECHHCHGATRKNLGGMIVRQSTNELYASMADLRKRNILISFLGIVTITCLLYLIIARLVARPVADLSEKAGRVADGDLSVYFEVKTADSIGTLGQSFNSMVKTIKEQHDELESKIEERTRQLLDAQEELVRKEKLATLGQLSGSVAHELRNPLGVMSNAVYYLKTVMSGSDENVKEYLNIIKGEINNSERIISDLLDFSRTKTPQPGSIRVDELIKQSLGKCVIPENVIVRVNIPEILPLPVDPFQMVQVFQNLIMNAIQAMPEGGELSISARLISDFGMRNLDLKEKDLLTDKSEIQNQKSKIDGDFVEISVADTGVGISIENMKKLFQPLFTTKARGIGLGLIVSKNLVEANGGRIEMESQLGKGTAFIVTLPVNSDNI